MRLYHGTGNEFEGVPNVNMPPYEGGIGEGIYFGETPNIAAGYGPYIHEVEVDLKNPLIIDAASEQGEEINYRIAPEIQEEMQGSGGFDSILVGERVPPFDVLIGGQWREIRDGSDMEEIGDMAAAAGHDAVIFRNARYGSSLNSEVLIMDPSVITKYEGKREVDPKWRHNLYDDVPLKPNQPAAPEQSLLKLRSRSRNWYRVAQAQVDALRIKQQEAARLPVAPWHGVLYHGTPLEGAISMAVEGIWPPEHNELQASLLSTSINDNVLKLFADGEKSTGFDFDASFDKVVVLDDIHYALAAADSGDFLPDLLESNPGMEERLKQLGYATRWGEVGMSEGELLEVFPTVDAFILPGFDNPHYNAEAEMAVTEQGCKKLETMIGNVYIRGNEFEKEDGIAKLKEMGRLVATGFTVDRACEIVINGEPIPEPADPRQMSLELAEKTAQTKAPALKQDSSVFWHGSPSGDLRGGTTGLHLGTYLAAKEALEARIGIPVYGEWDGTREYGKTLLMGQKRQREMRNTIPYFGLTGFNCHAPEEDFYPAERSSQYSDKTFVSLSSRPAIQPFHIRGQMTNSPYRPMEDFKANSTMGSLLQRQKARRGYYYKNISEDKDSISAVVPSSGHLEPVKTASAAVTLPVPREGVLIASIEDPQPFDTFTKEMQNRDYAYEPAWDPKHETTKALSIGGYRYPTFIAPDEKSRVAFDPTEIYSYKGSVRVGDPSARNPKQWTLQGLIVDPSVRGQGIGGQTLQHIHDAADRAGITLLAEPTQMKQFVAGQPALSSKQLAEWYLRHGWQQKEPGSNLILIRKPKPVIEQQSWFARSQMDMIRYSAKKKILAIDFDRTIAGYAKYPDIGKPINGVNDALRELREAGYAIRIYTCRLNDTHKKSDRIKERKKIEAWLKKYRIIYDDFAEAEEGKIFADFYIDDKAIKFDGDWKDVVKQILK